MGSHLKVRARSEKNVVCEYAVEVRCFAKERRSDVQRKIYIGLVVPTWGVVVGFYRRRLMLFVGEVRP